MTGYANPNVGQVLVVGEKLSNPYHDRLFLPESTRKWTLLAIWKARCGRGNARQAP
jgi:hypothetical protein